MTGRIDADARRAARLLVAIATGVSAGASGTPDALEQHLAAQCSCWLEEIVSALDELAVLVDAQLVLSDERWRTARAACTDIHGDTTGIVSAQAAIERASCALRRARDAS